MSLNWYKDCPRPEWLFHCDRLTGVITEFQAIAKDYDRKNGKTFYWWQGRMLYRHHCTTDYETALILMDWLKLHPDY